MLLDSCPYGRQSLSCLLKAACTLLQSGFFVPLLKENFGVSEIRVCIVCLLWQTVWGHKGFNQWKSFIAYFHGFAMIAAHRLGKGPAHICLCHSCLSLFKLWGIELLICLEEFDGQLVVSNWESIGILEETKFTRDIENFSFDQCR